MMGNCQVRFLGERCNGAVLYRSVLSALSAHYGSSVIALGSNRGGRYLLQADHNRGIERCKSAHPHHRSASASIRACPSARPDEKSVCDSYTEWLPLHLTWDEQRMETRLCARGDRRCHAQGHPRQSTDGCQEPRLQHLTTEGRSGAYRYPNNSSLH